MSEFAEVLSQVIAEQAQEEEQRQADQRSGYITGRLIVDSNQVSLQVESRPQNYELIRLFPGDEIEIQNRSKFIKISEEDAIQTMSTDGFPLYAGCYARVKR